MLANRVRTARMFNFTDEDTTLTVTRPTEGCGRDAKLHIVCASYKPQRARAAFDPLLLALLPLRRLARDEA